MSAQQALGVAAQERGSWFTTEMECGEDERREGRIMPQDEGHAQERLVGLRLELGAGARELGGRVETALLPALGRSDERLAVDLGRWIDGDRVALDRARRPE